MDFSNLANKYGGVTKVANSGMAGGTNFHTLANKYGGEVGQTRSQYLDQKSYETFGKIHGVGIPGFSPADVEEDTPATMTKKTFQNLPGSALKAGVDILEMGFNMLMYDNPMVELTKEGREKGPISDVLRLIRGAEASKFNFQGDKNKQEAEVFQAFEKELGDMFGPAEGYKQLAKRMFLGKKRDGIDDYTAMWETMDAVQRLITNDPFDVVTLMAGGGEGTASIIGKEAKLNEKVLRASELISAPAEDAINIAKRGAEKAGDKIRNITTPMEEGVESVLRGQAGVDKFDNYLESAKVATQDYHNPTPLELAGNEAKRALDLMKGEMDKAMNIKTNIVRDMEGVKVPKAVNEAVRNFKDMVADRIGGGFTKDGELIELPGRALVADSADITLLENAFRRFTNLNANPSFRAIDDTIDALQSVLYKSKQMGAVPINDTVQGLLKEVVGGMNSQLKLVGGTQYRTANSYYRQVRNSFDWLNKALGKDVNKGGSLMKRVFSPTDGGTKKYFDKIRAITGIDLVDEATLAKLAMEIAGDARQASLLEQLELLRVPTKGSFVQDAGRWVLKRLQNQEKKARSIIEDAVGNRPKLKFKTPDAYKFDIQPGLTIKDVSKKLDNLTSGDIKTMENFLEKVRGKKKLTLDEETTARALANEIGVNPNANLKTIADSFEYAIFRKADNNTISKLIKTTKDSVKTNLDDFVSIKNEPAKSLKNAEDAFQKVIKGKMAPRKPVYGVKMNNGKTLVTDGNATIQSLRKLGFKGEVPVELTDISDLGKLTDTQLKDALKLYQKGDSYVKDFDKLVGSMAKDLKLKQISPGDVSFKLKPYKSILNKLYKRGESVRDLVRDTIVAKPEDVSRVVDWLKKNGAKGIESEGRIAGLKDRFKTVKSGYRDANYQFKIGDNIYELQIMGENMLFAKGEFGHYVYDVTEKAIKVLEKKGLMTPQVKNANNWLMSEMNRVYNKAFELDQAGKLINSIDELIPKVKRSEVMEVVESFSKGDFKAINKKFDFDPLAPTVNADVSTKETLKAIREIKDSESFKKFWDDIYADAQKITAGKMLQLKNDKMKGLSAVHLTKNCNRLNFLSEFKKRGIIPEKFKMESCYGGACYKDRDLAHQLKKNTNPLDSISEKKIEMATPETIKKFFDNPENVKKMNDSRFIRLGQAGDDSHAIATGIAEEFLKQAKANGVKSKMVFVTSAYAPTSLKTYQKLAKYKDMFVLHVTESGYFSRGEILNRFDEFMKAKEAGLNVKMRVVTNKDMISSAERKADIAKVGPMETPEEGFLFDLIDDNKLENVILETPYHNDFLGKSARSMETGKYKAVCCMSGKCSTCGFACLINQKP